MTHHMDCSESRMHDQNQETKHSIWFGYLKIVYVLDTNLSIVYGLDTKLQNCKLQVTARSDFLAAGPSVHAQPTYL